MGCRAIEIPGHGHSPEVVERDEPVARAGESLVRLSAAGINPVDLAIASGRFYLPVPAPPYVAGAEAVGEVVESNRFAVGTRVWCLTRTGAYAERFVAADSALIEVPDGPTDAQAVACGIAGLAGWMATTTRGACAEGDHVLVLGAQGVVGKVATAAARARAAARVVGVVRHADDGPAVVSAGADAWVTSEPEHLEERLMEAMGGTADLVIDTLWGEPGRAALRSLGMRGRHIQVGNAASATVELPAGPLRGGRLDIRGFSIFNEDPDEIARSYRELCEVMAHGGVTLEIEEVPLGQARAAWQRQLAGTGGKKLVLVPDSPG